MRETETSIEAIVGDLLSGSAHKIWSASCAICSLSQNHSRIADLLPYKQQIKNATRGINLGGALAPNSRFLKKALEIMDFHDGSNGCPCCLLEEDANPVHCVKDGYFILVDTVHVNASNYIDYYIVQCKSCGKTYKVEEREYHYTWWKWLSLDKDNQN